MFIEKIQFTELLRKIDSNHRGLYTLNLTSEQASFLVEKYNVKNRRVRQTLVEYLRKQVDSGEWQEDHPQPIVFSDKKRLIDGQHRLFAISGAEVDANGVQVRVEIGARDEVRQYLDTGIVRTLDDRIEFVPDLAKNRFIAQLINIRTVLLKVHSRSGKSTPEESKDFFETHKQAILWTAETWKKGIRGISQIPIAFAAMEYWEINAFKASEFFPDLFVPVGEVQQAQMLRDFALRHSEGRTSGRGGKGGGQMPRLELYHKSVGCMKAHLEDREVKRVMSASW